MSGILLLALAVHGKCAPVNLARMDGCVAVADSEHRSRWGVDGYHASLAIDGDTRPAACWASDNWEVTHTLAVIFPCQVSVQSVRVVWGGPGASPVTSRRLAIEGFRAGKWEPLGMWVSDRAAAASPVLTTAAGAIEALRLVQPPGGAAPDADRRLWIAEIEVAGEPVQPRVAVDTAALTRRCRDELAAQRRGEDAARVAPALAVVMRRAKTRGFQSIIDRQDRDRGRQNAASRPWARKLAAQIIADADWWCAQTDEYVYGLIPAGNPRALCPSFELGCPIHGGARGTFTATLDQPYRWRCSKGGETWYDGCTVKHPESGAEVVVHDDGNGWLAPAGFLHPGRRYYFVAAYRYYLLGKLFASPYEGDGGSKYRGGTPIQQLALAYALTGETKYSHKAGLMLLRLADLYATYDGCIEGPSQRQDGYIGQTFERFLVQNLILAADLVWDGIATDSSLVRFFAARGDINYTGTGRRNGDDLTYHLQRDLLGYVYEYLHRLMPYLDGDFVMYEMTALAALAHCLGSPELVSEALDSDLGLRVLLSNEWFRDGKFIYDSTGYNVGNAQTPLLIGEWLHGCVAPPQFPTPLDLYHDPRYRLGMLYDFLRYVDCDGRVPQIGDVGGSRGVSLRTTPAYSPVEERALLRLPEQAGYYASRLLAAAGGDLEAFRGGRADWWTLFHAQEPLAGQAAAASPPASHLFCDGQIAILRAGADPATRQHVPLTFSKGSYAHGHGDKLAINVLRYGYDFSADLGYPTTWTDIKCGGWEKHTASHCTVMLDEQGQRMNAVGKLALLALHRPCDVVEASCEGAYPQSSVYRRTVALVRDEAGEPLYTADIFRIAGATTRDYLFHSLGSPEDLTVSLATSGAWEAQATGSLAGPAVAPMSRPGYSFLFDLHRVRTDGGVSAVWRPSTGVSQPDRYLLTRRSYRTATVTFTLTRTGKPSGDRERAVFVFTTAPGNESHRRVIMLPVDQFPVGKPVAVRVEVEGPQAKLWVAGKPCGGVDVAGAPADSGSLGLLHYYNYDWEYRDLTVTVPGEAPTAVDFGRKLDPAFWARIDATYEAGDGALRVSDRPQEAFHLTMVGAPGREVIRAKAEGYGVRGQSPFEGHLIVRDRVTPAARGSVFAGVLEATRSAARVRQVTRLAIVPAGHGEHADCDAVALRIDSADGRGPRVDYLLSALDDTVLRQVAVDGMQVAFRGRFGFVTRRDGQVTDLVLLGGGELACGGQRITSPGNVGGAVVRSDTVARTLTLRTPPGGPAPTPAMVGRHLLVRAASSAYPSVYQVVSVAAAGADLWTLGVNMPFALAWGAIERVDPAGGVVVSRPPVMKLSVNPGLFDGKLVRAVPDGTPVRLKSAVDKSFVLADREGIDQFRAGGEYEVLDVGAGDSIEIVAQTAWRSP